MDLSILFNKEGRCWLTLTAGLLNALDKSDKLIYHRIRASSDSKLSDASFQNENSSICLEIFIFLGVCKPTNMGNYFPISKYWKVQINVITLLKLSTWQKHRSQVVQTLSACPQSVCMWCMLFFRGPNSFPKSRVSYKWLQCSESPCATALSLILQPRGVRLWSQGARIWSVVAILQIQRVVSRHLSEGGCFCLHVAVAAFGVETLHNSRQVFVVQKSSLVTWELCREQAGKGPHRGCYWGRKARRALLSVWDRGQNSLCRSEPIAALFSPNHTCYMAIIYLII